MKKFYEINNEDSNNTNELKMWQKGYFWFHIMRRKNVAKENYK